MGHEGRFPKLRGGKADRDLGMLHDGDNTSGACNMHEPDHSAQEGIVKVNLSTFPGRQVLETPNITRESNGSWTTPAILKNAATCSTE
eukprot:4204346-Karenia_brevis.AAC.1